MAALNDIVDRMTDVKLIEQALSNGGVSEVEIALYLLGRGLIKGVKEEIGPYILLIMEDDPLKLLIGIKGRTESHLLELHTAETLLKVFGEEEALSLFKSMREKARVMFRGPKDKGGQRSGKR